MCKPNDPEEPKEFEMNVAVSEDSPAVNEALDKVDENYDNALMMVIMSIIMIQNRIPYLCHFHINCIFLL